MRVIAGKYRGRRLISPDGDNIRPTTDKIKESLFNILRNDLEDAVVVDLFAGSGSLGIEALSRGAKKVYFCDIDNRALTLIKNNLAFCDREDYEIIKGDFSDCIRKLASRNVKADIIICDPPYRFKKGEEILKKCAEAAILNASGIITIERAAADGALPDREYFLTSTRKYGTVAIDVFRNVTKAAVTGTFDPFTNGHRYLVEEALKEFGAVYVVALINEQKQTTYSVKERLKIMETALQDLKKQVRVEFYGGFAADYCLERGIKYIIRGVRTSEDMSYEREMADFNFRRSGVNTILLPAKQPEISSTAVKEKLLDNQSIDGMVDEEIIPYLVKEE